MNLGHIFMVLILTCLATATQWVDVHAQMCRWKEWSLDIFQGFSFSLHKYDLFLQLLQDSIALYSGDKERKQSLTGEDQRDTPEEDEHSTSYACHRVSE